MARHSDEPGLDSHGYGGLDKGPPFWRWNMYVDSKKHREWALLKLDPPYHGDVFYMQNDSSTISDYLANTKPSATWSPIGRMARWVTSQIVTPPITRFAAVEYPPGLVPESWKGTPKNYIHFWIQPYVYAQTGQIMRGFPRLSTTCRPVDILDPKLEGTTMGLVGDAGDQGPIGRAMIYTGEVIQQLQAALDSFLQTGAPDPRFL